MAERIPAQKLAFCFGSNAIAVNFGLEDLGYQRRPTEEESDRDPGLKWVPTDKGRDLCEIRRKVAGKKQEAWLVWDPGLVPELKEHLAPVRAKLVRELFTDLRAQVESLQAQVASLELSILSNRSSK